MDTLHIQAGKYWAVDTFLCNVLSITHYYLVIYMDHKNYFFVSLSMEKKILISLTRWPKTDRRTDMAKLIVAVRNFANALKNTEIYFSLNLPYSQCNGLVSIDHHVVVTLHLFY
jgi:hypothetical protein